MLLIRSSPRPTETFAYRAQTSAGVRWYVSKSAAKRARAKDRKARKEAQLETSERRRLEAVRTEREAERLASLHPEQRRAWNRIQRHLDRAPGRFAWRDVRTAFYGQGRKCFYCQEPFAGGPKPSTSIFHIEHKKPVYHGGTNDPDNLCLACPACNLEKGAAPFHDYIRSRRRRGLTAPTRSQEFPLFDLPERLAEEREQRERARRAAAMPAQTAETVIRRRPERGKATAGIEPLRTPSPPSRKAKATGEARTRALQ